MPRPELGGGVYTIPDVSRILRLPQHRVRLWLAEYWNGVFAKYRKKCSWGTRRDKAVGFHALIEFYIFYQLREHGVSAFRVVKAHESIAKTLKTSFPFASSRIMTDGRVVLFSPKGEVSLISADETLQLNLKEVIERYLLKIDFSEDDLAERFYPNGKNSSIVVDPHHQFGQPTVKGTNISVQALYSYHKGGESASLLSNLFELPEEQVREAIEFFSRAA
jgi:uncharacterized protein (DUF433 family)